MKKPTEFDFILAVSEMRHLQREFFRTRNSLLLKNAKRMEKKVDELLEQFITSKTEQQKTLF